jgi:hypothetical protein
MNTEVMCTFYLQHRRSTAFDFARTLGSSRCCYGIKLRLQSLQEQADVYCLVLVRLPAYVFSKITSNVYRPTCFDAWDNQKCFEVNTN